MEGVTKEFDALHPDPLYFAFKDAAGRTVSFKTPVMPFLYALGGKEINRRDKYKSFLQSTRKNMI